MMGVRMEDLLPGTALSGNPLNIWGEPFVKVRLPKMYNLRTDPYERADITSNTYNEWHIRHVFIVYPVLASVGKFVERFKNYPPAQHPDSFTPTVAARQAACGRSRGVEKRAHDASALFARIPYAMIVQGKFPTVKWGSML